MKSGVYRINLGNGNFYVGSALNLNTRKREHLAGLKSGKHCNRRMIYVFRKYGVFEFVVLETCPPSERVGKEQELLDCHFDDPKNVNMCRVANSTAGLEKSKATRQLLSKALTGHSVSDETRQALRLALTGRPLSQTHRDKVVAAATGRKHPIPSEGWKKAQSLKQKGRKLPPRSKKWCDNIAKSAKASPLVMSQIEKIHNAQKGKPLTEEHKQNIRIARRAYFERKRNTAA